MNFIYIDILAYPYIFADVNSSHSM
jgi:hypothetical protein